MRIKLLSVLVLLWLPVSLFAQTVVRDQGTGITVDGVAFPSRMELVCTWAIPLKYQERTVQSHLNIAIQFRHWWYDTEDAEPWVTGAEAAALYPVYHAEYPAGAVGGSIVFEGSAGGLIMADPSVPTQNVMAMAQSSSEISGGFTRYTAVGQSRLFVVVNPSGCCEASPLGNFTVGTHVYSATSAQAGVADARVIAYVKDSLNSPPSGFNHTPDEAWIAHCLFMPVHQLGQFLESGSIHENPTAGGPVLSTMLPTWYHLPIESAVTRVVLVGKTINLYTSPAVGMYYGGLNGDGAVRAGIGRLKAANNPTIPQAEYIFAKFEIVEAGSVAPLGGGGLDPDCCAEIVAAVGAVEDQILAFRSQFGDYYSDWSTWAGEWRTWRDNWLVQDDFVQTKLAAILAALASLNETGNPTGVAVSVSSSTPIASEPLNQQDTGALKDGLAESIEPLSMPTGTDATTPPVWNIPIAFTILGFVFDEEFTVDFAPIDPWMPGLRAIMMLGVTLTGMQWVWMELRRQ